MKLLLIRAAIYAAITAIAVTTLASGIAYAGPSASPSLETTPISDSAVLSPPNASDMSRSTAAITCIGRSSVPRLPFPAAIDVISFGETDCDTLADSVSVDTNMQRLRFYGWETLDTALNARVQDFSVTAATAFRCDGDGIYTYRENSYHLAYFAGAPYSASTRSAENRFDC